MKRFFRLQKWGVWEHLDEGKDLLQSIQESDEYTDYWLDRRLGCRQLGMNLSRRVVMRRLIEIYRGTNQRYQGKPIRTTYFERDYAPGIATDKLSMEKYAHPGYAVKLAELLGRAGASSLIVGRSLDLGTRPVFDDGDEVVLEGEAGLPREILVCDHSGAFGEYKQPLAMVAAHYARPVNVRDKALPDAREFAACYLAAFRDHEREGLCHTVWTFHTPFIGAICNCQDDILLAPWTTIKYRVSGSTLASVNQSSAATATDPSKQVNTLNTLYPGSPSSLYPIPSATQAADTPLPVRFTNVDQILTAADAPEDIPVAIRQITQLLHERHRIRAGQPVPTS